MISPPQIKLAYSLTNSPTQPNIKRKTEDLNPPAIITSVTEHIQPAMIRAQQRSSPPRKQHKVRFNNPILETHNIPATTSNGKCLQNYSNFNHQNVMTTEPQGQTPKREVQSETGSLTNNTPQGNNEPIHTLTKQHKTAIEQQITATKPHNPGNWREFIQSVELISNSAVQAQTKSNFQFNFTLEAAEENTKILKQHNYNLAEAIAS